MKDKGELQMHRTHWLRYCGLFGLLCLGVPVMLAQSSVTIKVEDTHGKAVSGAEVMGQRVEKKTGSEETLSKEVLKSSKSDGVTYTFDGLTKGTYKFYACDPDLTHEPDYRELSVGKNESSKFTLILQEQPTTQPVADPGMKPGSKVCLVHDETGCRAIRMIDRNGEITSAGVRNHYHIEEPEPCKKD